MRGKLAGASQGRSVRFFTTIMQIMFILLLSQKKKKKKKGYADVQINLHARILHSIKKQSSFDAEP
jgi:hypothetical protein